MSKSVIRDISPEERQLLARIKRRPGLFIVEPSLRNFRHMTGGYTLAMYMIGEGERRSLLPDHLGLSEFVAVHYGEKLSGYSWCSLILKHERDDGTALNTFFVLLDEYLISLGYEPIPKPEV